MFQNPSNSSFLYYAIDAGLDMGIVNAGQLAVYDDIEPPFCAIGSKMSCSTDNRRSDAKPSSTSRKSKKVPGIKREKDDAWREGTVEERLSHALIRGIVDHIVDDTEEARKKYGSPARGDRRTPDGRNECRR